MSVTMKTERQDLCGICNELLCSADSAFVNEDIVELLKFVIEEIDTSALQNSPICEECLTKIKEAYQFKMVHVEASKRDIKMAIKEEYDCDTEFVICYCCKSTVAINFSMALLDVTNLDVSNYLFKKEDLQKADNPQICNICQASISNLYDIITLLSIYDKSKFKHEQLDSEYPHTIDITEEFMDQDIKSDVNKIEFKEEVKEEKMDSEEENSMSPEDMQIKTEELILKTDGSEEISAEEGLKHQDSFERSNLKDVRHTQFKSAADTKEYIGSELSTNKNLDTTEMFKCAVCDFKTKFKKSLHRHSLIHKDIKEIDMFSCDVCPFQSKFKAYVKRHSKIHSNIKETEMFNNIDTIEMFKCDICDFKTKSKNNLQRHSILHRDVKETEMFSCNICGFKSKFKPYLKRHSLIHKTINEIKVFKCDACDYKTKFKADLKLHKSIHEIERFSCDVCDYKSKWLGHLKRHSLIHKDINEIEMFRCDVCDFETKCKRSLRNHSLKHKNSSEIETIKCDLCDYETTVKERFQQHSINHKPTDEIEEVVRCDISKVKTKYKHNFKIISIYKNLK